MCHPLAIGFVALCAALVHTACDTRPVGEPPDLGPSHARLASGDVAGALAAAEAALDGADEGASAQTCDAVEALAQSFYEAGTHESVEGAQRLFERALGLRERRPAENPAALGQLLHDLSGLAFNRDDHERAEAWERRALEVRERGLGPDDPATIESRRDLGFIYAFQGRLAEARPHLEQALADLESAPEPDTLSVALARNYLAWLDTIEGRHAEAEARYLELIRAGPEGLGDAQDQFPFFLNNLAGVYRDQERFDEAETLLRRSLALRERTEPRDEKAIANATLNLAELYRAQGKHAEAEPLYLAARELAEKVHGPDSPGMIEFVNQLGVLYRDLDDAARAEPLFEAALRLAAGGPSPADLRVAVTQLDLAELQRTRGNCEQARQHYARALEIRERILGPAHAAVAEVLVAEARCRGNDPASREAARHALDRAIAILERSETDPLSKVDALALRAELSGADDAARANSDLAAALDVVEALRPHRGGGESARAEFLDRYVNLYSLRVRQEVEAGRADRAFEVAERARARVLLDQLAVAGVGERGGAQSAATGRQEQVRSLAAELRKRIEFEQVRTDLPRDERVRRVADLERRQDDAARELRELWDRARNETPAWRAAVAGSPLSAEELQRRVAPPDGLVLAYSLGDEGSFVFAVPPSPGTIEAFALTVSPANAAELHVAAGPLTRSALHRILAGEPPQDSTKNHPGLLARLALPRTAATRGLGGLVSLDGEVEPALNALWGALVPPEVWRRIAAATRVVVVPEGALCLLPFEALVVQPGSKSRGARYWLDEGPAIRYAPSATSLARLVAREAARRKPASQSVLSVSDPAYAGADPADRPDAGPRRSILPSGGGRLERLPGTARESRAVRESFGDEASFVLLEGTAAREAAVRLEIPDKRWVHLATHGFVDERSDALFAALAFAPPLPGVPRGDDDGFLQLFEIYELSLNCDLAVLSACSSNAGSVVTSEGVFALSRGFLVAGARSVVASQWAVDDASTADLIGGLFRRIASARGAEGSTDVTLALRDAKLALRQDPRWAHPFFWAPFVLTGLETR